MKILVFGFSVTAEKDGFVERAVARCAIENREYEITKVGIGGMQPFYSRHLVENIVAERKPDALILEIATATYRLIKRTDAQIAEHVATMEAAFAVCQRHEIRCGILDLPQAGLKKDDWLAATNSSLAEKYGIPIRDVTLAETLLRDNVHPTDEGRDYYADELLKLLDQVGTTKSDFDSLRAIKRFDAIPVLDLSPSDAVFHGFARTEFRTQVLSLPAEKSFRLPLPRKLNVTGLLVMMGPASGTLKITIDENNTLLNCYDRHCYYERISGRILPPTLADEIVITQQPDAPAEKLLKGEKYLGARVGGVSHILYEA